MSKFRPRPKLVEAAQFDPAMRPWPKEVIPWTSQSFTPRDTSWGYIKGSHNTKLHVMAGDWIVTDQCDTNVVDPLVFEREYEAVE